MKHLPSFDEFVNEKKTVTYKELKKIAQKAGETVSDAEEALMDLAVSYENVPVDKINDVLDEFDLDPIKK